MGNRTGTDTKGGMRQGQTEVHISNPVCKIGWGSTVCQEWERRGPQLSHGCGLWCCPPYRVDIVLSSVTKPDKINFLMHMEAREGGTKVENIPTKTMGLRSTRTLGTSQGKCEPPSPLPREPLGLLSSISTALFGDPLLHHLGPSSQTHNFATVSNSVMQTYPPLYIIFLTNTSGKSSQVLGACACRPRRVGS